MASTSLIQAVEALVSKPEGSIKMKDVRKLVKDHAKELATIKLSGKGRTKISILDDLKLWLQQEKYIQHSPIKTQPIQVQEEFKSSSESLMLSPLGRPIHGQPFTLRPRHQNDINQDELLEQMGEMMDNKLSTLSTILLNEISTMMDNRLSIDNRDFDRQLPPLQQSGQTSKGGIMDYIKRPSGLLKDIILFPIRLFLKYFVFLLIWIRDWIVNAILAPFKWLSMPIRIIIGLVVFLILVQVIGVNYMINYFIWSLSTIWWLGSKSYDLVGAPLLDWSYSFIAYETAAETTAKIPYKSDL